ncbi:MAG: thiamine pyrophosphate-dependent enzyme [Candidatus Kuenenbacteria bacterium]
MINLKTLTQKIQKQNYFASGHRTCAGCAIPIIVRTILAASKDPVVVVGATGCLQITSAIYPQTSWNMPWMHNAFENASATISGIERAYYFLKKKNKTPLRDSDNHRSKKINFVVFGGDGGTYDIGLQSLSGALERGHNFVYVCYDNEAYMNTGNQRSSATPYGAITSTTPDGKKVFKKDLIKIVSAHNIPYVAQSAVHNWSDLYQKAEKAFQIKGPAVLNVFSPCSLNWKFPFDSTIQISKIATETCFWPLYEIENGQYKLNYQPKTKLPVEEFLKLQKRFAHLFKPENKKTPLRDSDIHRNIEIIQKKIDEKWQELISL